jgi:hypothetical protein
VSEASKEEVRRVLEEAFGQGKVEVIDEVLHSDFVCYDPNSESGEIRGAETIKREIEYFRQAFPRLLLEGRGPGSRRGQGGEPLHYGWHPPRGVLRSPRYGEAG